MTFLIIISILIGIFLGNFVFPSHILPFLEQSISWGLGFMLFLVGIDIGKSKDVIKKVKQMGWKIILIPFSIAVGSILGGILVSVVIDISLWEGAAVGSGMGWYSLSAVIIDQMHSTQLGAVAFLANVIREVLAILFIPLISKYGNHLLVIAPAGATSMDSTLPVIAKYTSPETAIIAFISGAILTAIIPFLVPFFLQFA